MRHLVLIEFVEATAKRAKGARLRVDARSATALVDVAKVAVRVVPGQPVAPPPPPPAPVAPPPADDDDPDAA